MAARAVGALVARGALWGAVVLLVGCAAAPRPSPPASAMAAGRAENAGGQFREDLEEMSRRVDAVASRAGDLENALALVGARVEAVERRIDQLTAALAHARATVPPGGGTPMPQVSPVPAPRSGEPGGRSQAPGTVTPTTAEELYRAGVAKFRAGDLDGAVLMLYDLVATHPGHPLREDAQFLVADIFFSQKDLGSALREFEALLVAVPNGSKTADALLKIGLCQQGLGDEAGARRTWQRLINEYGDSGAARQARGLLREARRR